MRLKDNVIAQARTRQGWTQEHLASVAGVSTRTIQRVEASGIASADTAQALCAVLDLSFAEIELPKQEFLKQDSTKVISISPPMLVCLVFVGGMMGFTLAQFL
ncbi:MAG: helix-turn-helix transcriptional regulator [Paracoccaceae bacterium]|nr:helix-turn-helix transcriptional regulator [Paracoccaceae bacterium]